MTRVIIMFVFLQSITISPKEKLRYLRWLNTDKTCQVQK